MPSSTELLLPSRHPIAHPTGGHTSLYLVRHGRTLGNVQKLLVGWTDIPLDQLGVQQADLVGQRLAGSITADVLLSSPLQRARVTAEAIGSRMGLIAEIRPNLVEWHFGVAEGQAVDVLAGLYPEIAARFEDLQDSDVGWPEGETRRQLHERVYAEFLDILQTYASHAVIIVAHGGVFGSLLAQIQGKDPNDWRRFNVQNCSVTHLDVTVEDTTIHLINDVEHLNSLANPSGTA
jgi:broad specificity phosphatase PhoE